MDKESLELLLRARDYIQMVADEIDEKYPDNEYTNDSPNFLLGIAIDNINRALPKIF